MYIVDHIKTTNDVNGNSRRAYVVRELGKHYAHIVDVVNEGARGEESLKDAGYTDYVLSGEYYVPVKEYREHIKLGERIRKNRLEETYQAR